MAAVLNLLKIVVVLIVLAIFIGMFMKNAGTWGTNVGEFFTAIKTFIENLFTASPLG